MSKEEINAFLGASTEYTGKLVFQGAVRIDGVFRGEIVSEGSLIVGKDAHIEGTVYVGELVLSGLMSGKVFAKKRVTMHKGGKLVGNIYSPNLVIEDGAILQGSVDMESDVTSVTTNQAEKSS